MLHEGNKEKVFHNRQKLNCQCPAQSKAFTCFSMQSTLRCERWLTSFDKRTAQLYTPVRERLVKSQQSPGSLCSETTDTFLAQKMLAITCRNK